MTPLKILIVEDEKPISELIAFHLESQNYITKFAYDGETAVESVESWLPDLVVLDWMLPNISGIEVLKRIRRKDASKNIPVIMLTAKGQEDDKVRGFELGVDDYILKPFLPSELLARVKALLRRSKKRENDDVVKEGRLVEVCLCPDRPVSPHSIDSCSSSFLS